MKWSYVAWAGAAVCAAVSWYSGDRAGRVSTEITSINMNEKAGAEWAIGMEFELLSKGDYEAADSYHEKVTRPNQDAYVAALKRIPELEGQERRFMFISVSALVLALGATIGGTVLHVREQKSKRVWRKYGVVLRTVSERDSSSAD